MKFDQMEIGQIGMYTGPYSGDKYTVMKVSGTGDQADLISLDTGYSISSKIYAEIEPLKKTDTVLLPCAGKRYRKIPPPLHNEDPTATSASTAEPPAKLSWRASLRRWLFCS